MNKFNLINHNANNLKITTDPINKALGNYYLERYREVAHKLAAALDNGNPGKIIYAGKSVCDSEATDSTELLKIYKMLPAGKAKSEILDYFRVLYHNSGAFKHYRNCPYGLDDKQKEPN